MTLAFQIKEKEDNEQLGRVTLLSCLCGISSSDWDFERT